MKSLKECLLNEVRLTIHNTKVVKFTKKFGDLKLGDEIYECYLSKSAHEYSIEKGIIKDINKGHFNCKWFYFKNGLLGEEKFKASDCIDINYIKDDNISAIYGWSFPKDLQIVIHVVKAGVRFLSTSESLIDDAINKLQLL